MTHPGKLCDPRSFIEKACDVMNKVWYVNESRAERAVTANLSVGLLTLYFWSGDSVAYIWDVYDDQDAADGFAVVNSRLNALMEHHTHD